ncbi:hypothetical protein [Stenotrophomonas rhizophila]|uniref:hypothetical protein n=1 Tax=Stenotrophomonas rhizophila TaxID=216778 RepID=UPI0011AA43E5|nr:hypothetical protein [Stenotrophomonas rhizophila]
MIEAYLDATRRRKSAGAELSLVYQNLFASLAAGFGERKPQFVTVYSTACAAELVRVGGSQYVVYDQHLGQVFNQLNRIYFATSNQGPLVLAFAYKRLAHLSVTKGSLKLATLMAMVYARINTDVKSSGDPYTSDLTEERARLAYTLCQEITVIAHELGHVAMQSDEGRCKAVEDALRDHLRAKIESPRCHKGVAERYGDAVASSVAEDHDAMVQHWEQVLEGLSSHLVEEAGSDEVAALLSISFATKIMAVPAEDACVGVLLAFKYLRLLGHLEGLSSFLLDIDIPKNISPGELSGKILSAFWGGFSGLGEAQLREHFIFSSLASISMSLGHDGEKCIEAMRHARDRFDLRVELMASRGLADHLSEVLLADFKYKILAVEDIDLLLGWKDATISQDTMVGIGKKRAIWSV